MTDSRNDLRRLPTTAVGPDVIAALEHLSTVTGLAKTYLIRSILAAALTDLGLLTGTVEPQPTKRRTDH